MAKKQSTVSDEEKIRAVLAIGGKKPPAKGTKTSITPEEKEAILRLKGKKKKK